jgi:hypothetical protein
MITTVTSICAVHFIRKRELFKRAAKTKSSRGTSLRLTDRTHTVNSGERVTVTKATTAATVTQVSQKHRPTTRALWLDANSKLIFICLKQNSPLPRAAAAAAFAAAAAASNKSVKMHWMLWRHIVIHLPCLARVPPLVAAMRTESGKGKEKGKGTETVGVTETGNGTDLDTSSATTGLICCL